MVQPEKFKENYMTSFPKEMLSFLFIDFSAMKEFYVFTVWHKKSAT